MKAALVSATSLAALLAFEVGLDVAIDAQPARAQQYSQQSFGTTSLNFGYVLLNISGGTTASLTETASNASTLSAGGPQVATNTVTFSAVATPFGGAVTTATLGTVGSSVTAKNVYQFTPTVTGTYSSSLLIGSRLTYSGFTNIYTATVPMTGTAVAPVQSTSLKMSTVTINKMQAGSIVRIGTTATIAAITVSNIGDGNLASKTAPNANLTGSLGAPSGSVFKGSGGSFTLNDTNYGSGATTSAALTYTYAPTAHGTDTATVVASFTDGSSAGTNAAQTTSLTLTATAVGPTYESQINGTTYTNSTAIGAATVSAGTVSIAARKGVTSTTTITVANISNDATPATLTDLTLESFSLSGANASDFSVVGFSTDTTVAENTSVTVTLDFSGPTVGIYNADLTFDTDQGAPSGYGGAGAMFAYVLTASIPEPATVITFGIGLAGLGWARRRRATRATGTGVPTGC
jgi:hypothetical protein